jgi:glycosyltransferase involved in cell wall biosynthesis
VARGHTVDAWCPPTADPSYLPLGDVVAEHTKPLDWKAFDGRNPLTRFITPYKDVTAKLAAMDRHCRACADDINAGGYDVLFANSCMFFRTTSIGKHVTIPRLLYLQEPFRWLYEAIPRLPWPALPPFRAGDPSVQYLKRFIRNLVEVQALRVQAREEVENARSFDTILVNSLFSRESLLRAYGLSAKVCYLGVDTNVFVDQQLPREGFVVGLGAMVPEKRIPLVIDAISRLPEPRPPLVWIGNIALPGYLEELQAFARSKGVDLLPKVGIPDKDVVSLLNRAAMLVYAPRLEPFGLAPLEANACGLPVVAVAEGGVRETVRDGVNGLLVEDDPGAIARAIARLLADPVYASRLGHAGVDHTKQLWSVDASIDRLEQRLCELVDQPRAR